MDTVIRELLFDVINPDADGRKRRDWTAWRIIPKGTRVIDNGSSLIQERGYSFVHRNSELGKAMVAQSKPVPPATLREVMATSPSSFGHREHDAEDLLGCLVEMGRIDENDLEDAFQFSIDKQERD